MDLPVISNAGQTTNRSYKKKRHREKEKLVNIQILTSYQVCYVQLKTMSSSTRDHRHVLDNLRVQQIAVISEFNRGGH